MGEFRISHVRITFGVGGREIKKADTRVVGWSPPDFFSGDGGATSSHPSSPHLGEGNWGDPISHTPHAKHPISPHIDEDALEGVYFAF